jgi:hypothetical protein
VPSLIVESDGDYEGIGRFSCGCGCCCVVLAVNAASHARRFTATAWSSD